MLYNAIEDAKRLRVVRKQVNENFGEVKWERLFIVMINLINPNLVLPCLIGLRDTLNGKSNNELNELISGIKEY